MQKLKGVAGRFLHRHVARHRGHQLQIKLGGEQRGGNRRGVINAGIGIQNDR
jgi:hypothetical protein